MRTRLSWPMAPRQDANSQPPSGSGVLMGTRVLCGLRRFSMPAIVPMTISKAL
jgi:hypothetical protein